MICCICFDLIVDGIGNNAQPVNEGRCCDECNARVVIPQRTKEMNPDRIFTTEQLNIIDDHTRRCAEAGCDDDGHKCEQ